MCFVAELDLTANFDRVFWLGDFNFRVSLGRSEVDGMLKKYKDQENPECKVSMQHRYHRYSRCFFLPQKLRTIDQSRFSLNNQSAYSKILAVLYSLCSVLEENWETADYNNFLFFVVVGFIGKRSAARPHGARWFMIL